MCKIENTQKKLKLIKNTTYDSRFRKVLNATTDGARRRKWRDNETMKKLAKRIIPCSYDKLHNAFLQA